MAITEEKVVLTPKLAGELLATNYEGQRVLNIGYARSLANDIAEGRWQSDVLRDYLEVSDNGKLINGQHRCKAVILAGEPILVGIRYGVPESQFAYIDGGKSRQTSQFVKGSHAVILSSLGKNVSAIEAGMPIASALKGITGNITEGNNKRSAVATRQEILRCVEEHREEFHLCAEQSQRIYRALHGGAKAPFAFALWIIGRVNGFNKVANFVDEIANNLPSSEAVAIGKNKGVKQIIEAKTKHVSIDNKFWVSLILAMYDGWSTDSRLSRHWTETSVKKYDELLNVIKEGKR